MDSDDIHTALSSCHRAGLRFHYLASNLCAASSPLDHQWTEDGHIRCVQIKYKCNDKPSLSEADDDFGKTVFYMLQAAAQGVAHLEAGKLHNEYWSRNISSGTALAKLWINGTIKGTFAADVQDDASALLNKCNRVISSAT